MQKLLSILLLIVVLNIQPSMALANMDEARKLLSVIDAIQDTECEVVYDGSHYDCAFVAKFARVFLVTHYKGETAEQWIDKWCSRSYSGKTIWVQENKKYSIARERLQQELKKQYGRTNN